MPLVLGLIGSVFTIIMFGAWIVGIVTRRFATGGKTVVEPTVVPATKAAPKRRPARVSSAASPRIVTGFGGNEAWAGTYATPGSYAERRRADMRARGITPSGYINGER